MIPATTSNKASFDLSGIPGGKRIKVRVTATDGLHSTSATSRIFRLPEHKPVAAIASVTSGDTLPASMPISLRGLAFDMEDGILGSKKGKYKWYVNKKYIASGRNAEIKKGLLPGRYVISLVVEDKSGKKGFDQAYIAVKTKSLKTDNKPGLVKKRSMKKINTIDRKMPIYPIRRSQPDK